MNLRLSVRDKKAMVVVRIVDVFNIVIELRRIEKFHCKEVLVDQVNLIWELENAQNFKLRSSVKGLKYQEAELSVCINIIGKIIEIPRIFQTIAKHINKLDDSRVLHVICEIVTE